MVMKRIKSAQLVNYRTSVLFAVWRSKVWA